MHGLADDNVHPRHSLLLAQALLAAGREHEVLLLPGVTHMAWQPEVIEQLLGAHVRFFRRWLGPDTTNSERRRRPMTVTILRNASVLDPETATLIEGQAVAVENGRIADVGPGLTGPGDAVIIDAGNRTVMPGLIDAHTHPAIVDEDVFGMAEWPPSYVAARAGRVLRGMLMRGFTSIRDAGAGDHGLARAVEEGYFDGPRMFYCGKQLTQTGGAGDWRGPSRVVYDRHYYTPAIGVICDGVAEVRRAVREEVRRGAHHIKVYLSGAVDSPSDRVDSTQFSMEELVAIVEEATAANIYVAGHAYTSRAINRGLRAGVRSIEHGNLMDASSIPLFREFGAFYVPTIVTYQTLAERARAGLLPADIAAKLGHVIDGALGALEMAYKADLPIVYGTDLFAGTHDQQLREFIIRSEIQPPADLIRAATTTAARLLRREGELGVIAPGALADLLVIDGNPLDDIRVLTTPDDHLEAHHEGRQDLQERALTAGQRCVVTCPRRPRCSVLSTSFGSTLSSCASRFSALVTAFWTAAWILVSPTISSPAWPGSMKSPSSLAVDRGIPLAR